MRNKKGQFIKGINPLKHKKDCNCFRCISEPRKLQGKYISCFYCKKPVYRELNEIKNYSKVFCNNDCRFPKVFNICVICNSEYRVKPSHAMGRTTCGSQECVIAYRKTLPAYWAGKERPDMKGENNWKWTSEKVNYAALHTWIKREKGNPIICKLEDHTCKGSLEWANISGEYKRDINDFMSLCHSHHVRYDRNNGYNAISKVFDQNLHRK